MFNLFKKAAPIIPITGVTRLSPNIVAHYPDFQAEMAVQRYISTDELYSIVRYLATTAALVPIYEYDKTGDEIKRDSIIDNPSVLISKFEFLEKVYSNLWLHGESFIAIDRGILGAPMNLQPLDPLRVVIHVSPYQIERYEYLPLPGGQKKEYQPDEVIHIKYFNPADEMRGLSPVKVLLKALHLLDSSGNVKQAQMQNGGLDSIVFEKTFDSLDSGTPVTESRKANFFKFISDPANKGVPYFAQGDMGAVKIGSTLADMQVLESEKVTFKRLCNVYGTSDILFNSDSSSTESNVREMIKRTYTNSVLPNVGRVTDGLKRALGLDFRYDISEIPELQTDMASLINSLNTAYWLTPNEKREAMKYGTVSDPMFDSYFIPNSVRPIDDLQMPEL